MAEMNQTYVQGYVGICPVCGKRRYRSRKDAKSVLRKLRGQGRQHVYQCGDYWHHGHLPRAVVKGDIGRDLIEVKPREVKPRRRVS